MTVNEKGTPVAAETEIETESEDKKPVDPVKAVLVDPNLHTDTRMRLHRANSEILATPH